VSDLDREKIVLLLRVTCIKECPIIGLLNPSFGIPDTNVDIPNLNFWIQGPSLGFVIRISLNIHSQEHKLHTCDKSGSFCTCLFLPMIVLRLTISNKSCGVFFSFLRICYEIFNLFSLKIKGRKFWRIQFNNLFRAWSGVYFLCISQHTGWVVYICHILHHKPTYSLFITIRTLYIAYDTSKTHKNIH